MKTPTDIIVRAYEHDFGIFMNVIMEILKNYQVFMFIFIFRAVFVEFLSPQTEIETAQVVKLLCVCVCVFGHVQTSLVSGQTPWLRGRTISYCIVSFRNKTDRLTCRQTDKP